MWYVCKARPKVATSDSDSDSAECSSVFGIEAPLFGIVFQAEHIHICTRFSHSYSYSYRPPPTGRQWSCLAATATPTTATTMMHCIESFAGHPRGGHVKNKLQPKKVYPPVLIIHVCMWEHSSDKKNKLIKYVTNLRKTFKDLRV